MDFILERIMYFLSMNKLLMDWNGLDVGNLGPVLAVLEFLGC